MKNSNRVQNNGIAVKTPPQAEKPARNGRKAEAERPNSGKLPDEVTLKIDGEKQTNSQVELQAMIDASAKRRGFFENLDFDILSIARGEYPDSVLANHLSKAIVASREVLRNVFKRGVRGDDFLAEQMEIFLIALRFEASRKISHVNSNGGECLYFNIPGLARNRSMNVRDILFEFSVLLQEHRDILLKQIPSMDVHSALLLAEALMISERECFREGMETEINLNEGKKDQSTKLERLARLKWVEAVEFEIWNEFHIRNKAETAHGSMKGAN